MPGNTCPCLGCNADRCCLDMGRDDVINGPPCNCGETTLDNGAVIRVVRGEPKPVDRGVEEPGGAAVWMYSVGAFWHRPYPSRAAAITAAYQIWDGSPHPAAIASTYQTWDDSP